MIYNQNVIRIKINRQVIRDNISRIKADSKMVIGVLKGNAYGCGLAEMGRLCLSEGIDFVAVSYISAAKSLCDRFDDRLRILLLLPLHDSDELQYAIGNNIRLTVTDPTQLNAINNVARDLGVKALIHLKVDCGLGRLGMQPDTLDADLINQISAEHCVVEGIYTHLSRANEHATMLELNKFDNMVKRLKGDNIAIPMFHALSSAQLDSRYVDYHYDAVRGGSAIFAQGSPLYATTRIIDVKTIIKGAKIGYGQDFTLNKTSKIGFIPVGYSLGLGLEPVSRYNDLKGLARVVRALLNKSQNKDYQGSVVINSKKYPLVGRIGMNISAVLLGDDDVPVGTEVVLSMRQAALPDSIEREYE